MGANVGTLVPPIVSSLPGSPAFAQVVTLSTGVTRQWNGSSWVTLANGLIDPKNGWELTDHMLANAVAGWYREFTGGSASFNQVQTVSTNPGVRTANYGNANNSRISVSLGDGSGFGTALVFGGGPVSVEYLVRVDSLSTSTDRFTLLCGFSDQNFGYSSSFGSHLGVHYRDDNNGGKWEFASRNSSTTVIDSGITVVQSTTTLNYKIRIDMNAAGTSATAYINGTSIGTITTNLPTAYIAPFCGGQKVAGTTSKAYWSVDYATAKQTLTTPL